MPRALWEASEPQRERLAGLFDEKDGVVLVAALRRVAEAMSPLAGLDGTAARSQDLCVNRRMRSCRASIAPQQESTDCHTKGAETMNLARTFRNAAAPVVLAACFTDGRRASPGPAPPRDSADSRPPSPPGPAGRRRPAGRWSSRRR